MDDVWGLISDVHGNYLALAQAITAVSAAGATKLAFLGDYLGRGDSERCVERIKEEAAIVIVGNRDLDWQDRVAPTTKAWVLGLPKLAQVGRLLVTHGDPRLTPALSTSEIGRDFVRAWRAMAAREASVWAFGHSHYARVWRKAGESVASELLRAETVDMRADGRYLVNVGATGLPFPGKGEPSVSVVDFARSEIKRLTLARV